MQLASRQTHQVLLAVDVVVIVAVMLDEQRPLLRETFHKQRHQRFRHQTQLQLLSVPRENLLRRKQRFPQLGYLIAAGIGQWEGHEILLVLFRIEIAQRPDAEVIPDDLPADLMRVAPDVIGDIGVTRRLIVIAVKIGVEQVDLLFVQIIKSVFKYHKYRFLFLFSSFPCPCRTRLKLRMLRGG